MLQSIFQNHFVILLLHIGETDHLFLHILKQLLYQLLFSQDRVSKLLVVQINLLYLILYQLLFDGNLLSSPLTFCNFLIGGSDMILTCNILKKLSVKKNFFVIKKKM